LPKLKIKRERKGSEEKGWEKKKGKNGRILGKPYPRERKEEREERRSIQTISKEMQ